MAAIIIPFFPSYIEENNERPDLEPLIHAAWEFARCALWPEQKLSFEEVEDTKDYIREYFIAANRKRRSFTALCQRIILTRNYLSKSSERFVPLPSVWFNRRYPFGFAGTLPWLYNVERQRKTIPGFLGHVQAFAEGYYAYAIKPTKKVYKRCRQELECYNATILIDLLDATVNGKQCKRA